MDVDVDRILEGQVVSIAIIGERHDFDVGVVKRRKGQFGAVGGEPHGVVAAENLLCDQKSFFFSSLRLQVISIKAYTFVHPVRNTIVHSSWQTVVGQFAD